MNNRLDGNRFEQQLCETLRNRGFWTHNMIQNKSGQPADIIAVNEHTAILIDAKVCKNNRFSLERVEDNQFLAMSYWTKITKNPSGFACYLEQSDEIKFIEFLEIKVLIARGVKGINPSDWEKIISFDEFVELYK